MLKELLMKSAAAAVCIWYCLCIIGFDIHTCSAAGEAFVISAVVENEGCMAIHPDISCNDGGAQDHCHESPASPTDLSFTAGLCCSDEFQKLDESCLSLEDSLRGNGSLLCPQVLAQVLPASEIIPETLPSAVRPVQPSICCLPITGEVCSFYSIFRI